MPSAPGRYFFLEPAQEKPLALSPAAVVADPDNPSSLFVCLYLVEAQLVLAGTILAVERRSALVVHWPAGYLLRMGERGRHGCFRDESNL